VDGPDPEATIRRRAQGKLSARERIAVLLDEESFVELDRFARHRATGFGVEQRRPDTDGVVTGWGTVDGRRVCVFAHDPRIFGGALGEVFAAKIHKLMDLAETMGVPMVGLNEGGGARIQEGVDALAGFGGIFRRNVPASGVVPQLSAVFGPCAGGAVYSPALTDFVFVVRDAARMFEPHGRLLGLTRDLEQAVAEEVDDAAMGWRAEVPVDGQAQDVAVEGL
jgi:acetyl-CoA carboxylase carboxyltransferase component